MATSNEEDDVISKQLSQQVEDLSMNNDMMMLTTCANCGKEGSNINNICNKCKAATYCNASCKKKHRSKHKVACERRVAELHEEELERERRAAELHDDEKLFKQPPPAEDCPICMLPLPSLTTGRKYRSCCGKMICSGCIHAVAKRDGGVGLCPFCRDPTPTPDEMIEQMKKRMEVDDAEAMHNLGCCYSHGDYGLTQDHAKALELYHQAGELGLAKSYYNIGNSYFEGYGVERDEKKAKYYWELAAIGGHVVARHNLGCLDPGNTDRALKHLIIAAGFGYNRSLEKIKQMFMNGEATKEDYAKPLRAYQTYLLEIKSPQRDEAAAFDDDYKYY